MPHRSSTLVCVLGLLALGAMAGPAHGAEPATVLPPNARANLHGSDWTCVRGYERRDGACFAVEVPSNAHLTTWGDDWECSRGFEKRRNACVAVQIPANA